MSSNLHSCLGPGRINITELQFLSTENARGINRRQIGNLQPLYFRSVGDLLGDLLLPRTRLSLSIPSTRPSLSHWFNLFFFHEYVLDAHCVQSTAQYSGHHFAGASHPGIPWRGFCFYSRVRKKWTLLLSSLAFWLPAALTVCIRAGLG